MVISYLLVCGIGNTLDINLIGWLSNSAFFKPSPIKYTLENNKSQRKYKMYDQVDQIIETKQTAFLSLLLEMPHDE